MALFSFITDTLFGKPPAAPAAPDYTGAAIAQGAANKETAVAQARLNNPNIYSPYGNQTVTWGAPDSTGVSQPTINQTLTPEAQRALTAQQNLQANLATLGGQSYGTAFDVMSKPFNYQGQVQTSLGNFNPLQSMPSAGQYGSASGGPDANYFSAQTGPSAEKYGLASGINPNQYGQAGGINAQQYGYARGGVNEPNLQSNLDLSGVAKMPVNAGTTGQEAIMSRLEPSLARNRVSTETQLVNQGLRPGTEAYDNAIKLLGQQENDQRTQAVLQGIGLDTSANAQGYGQALTSGQFGNQSQLSNFGANLQNQQAYNQAISQNYGQGLNAQQLQNQALAQNFGQGVTGQQLGNEAILQNFNLGQSANQAYNQAQSQNFAQRQLNAQMGNQAIAQNFGQGLTSAQAQNAQVAQQFNQAQQAAQFGNTANQQALAQAITQRQLPLNEINALMSGSQIQNPTFSPYSGSNIQAAPIANATAQQGAFDQNTYNQQTGTYNQNLAGLYSLAGAGAYGAAKSDRRLKSNINRIGTHKLGIGIYEYDIEGRHEIGVMAQEVEKVMPEAVIHHPDGYMMVQYGRINA